VDVNRKPISPAAPKAAQRVVTAAVVSRDGGAEAFPMFEAVEVTATGAFLAGPMLLEIDEELGLELALGDGAAVRSLARVTRVDRGARPGVHVAFVGMSAAARQQLDAWLAAAPRAPNGESRR
jgi:hypothetical protein